MSRPYNPEKDDYYYPDDTPEIYLTENQVEQILAQILALDDSAEKDARDEVRQIEKLHRMRCLGQITQEEYLEKCKEVSEEFGNKHGFWAWETVTVKSFYEYFSR